MMTTNDDYLRQVADESLDHVRAFWLDAGIPFAQATLLAFYQTTGGNAFALTDLDNEIHLAPRPEA